MIVKAGAQSKGRDGRRQITNPAAGQLNADHAIALVVGPFLAGIDNLFLSSVQDDVPAYQGLHENDGGRVFNHFAELVPVGRSGCARACRDQRAMPWRSIRLWTKEWLPYRGVGKIHVAQEFGMPGAALTPRVRLMAVCDAVKASHLEPGVFHLRGVRNYVFAPSFPFVPKRLWLYLLLSSPRKGRYPGYVRVIEDQAGNSGKTIFYSKIEPVPVFPEEYEFLPIPVRLACEFPHPGRYLIQVWFFQEETPDVIKAEQPFDVLQEP